jgi:hypothetical protein
VQTVRAFVENASERKESKSRNAKSDALEATAAQNESQRKSKLIKITYIYIIMRGSSVQSRHRNVFSKNAQSSEQFRNVQLGSVYLDNNPLRANTNLIAFPWNQPRGSVAVIKNSPHAIAE